MGDLGKIIVATGFEWLPKVQKISQCGHTGHGTLLKKEARSSQLPLRCPSVTSQVKMTPSDHLLEASSIFSSKRHFRKGLPSKIWQHWHLVGFSFGPFLSGEIRSKELNRRPPPQIKKSLILRENSSDTNRCQFPESACSQKLFRSIGLLPNRFLRLAFRLARATRSSLSTGSFRRIGLRYDEVDKIRPIFCGTKFGPTAAAAGRKKIMPPFRRPKNGTIILFKGFAHAFVKARSDLRNLLRKMQYIECFVSATFFTRVKTTRAIHARADVFTDYV